MKKWSPKEERSLCNYNNSFLDELFAATFEEGILEKAEKLFTTGKATYFVTY